MVKLFQSFSKTVMHILSADEMSLKKMTEGHLLLCFHIFTEFFSSLTFLLPFCYIGGHSWRLRFSVVQAISPLYNMRINFSIHMQWQKEKS